MLPTRATLVVPGDTITLRIPCALRSAITIWTFRSFVYDLFMIFYIIFFRTIDYQSHR